MAVGGRYYWLAALALGLALAAGAIASGWALALGMLTEHMAVHIVLMSALAPAIAGSLRPPARKPDHSHGLVAATSVQLGLFLGWHSPAGMALGTSSPIAQLAMHASLLVAAIWFWRNIFASARRSPWWAIAALILTGKVFCLVAALLVFAPRVIYPTMATGAADQHLSGLIMLVACPMTYIAASTVIVSRWLWSALREVPVELVRQV